MTVESSSIVYGVDAGSTETGGNEQEYMKLDMVHVHYVVNRKGADPLAGGATWHGNTSNAWYSGGRDKTWGHLFDKNGGVQAGTTFVFSKTTTHTGEGEEATYSVKYVREQNITFNTSSNDDFQVIAGNTYDQATYEAAVTAGKRGFKMYSGMPADVYAIRVYDRNLTTAEKKLNHYIDLLAFYQVDVPAGVTSEQLAVVAPSYYTTTFVADNNGVFEDYDSNKAKLTADMKAFDLAVNGVEKTVYDELYVKGGLVALYSAFGADVSYDVSVNNTWYNKVGDVNAGFVDTSSAVSFVPGANGQKIFVFSTF